MLMFKTYSPSLRLGDRADGKNLALEDPALHPDDAIGGEGFCKAKVDISTKRVQRHPAFAIPLVASHLGSAQSTGGSHANPLGAELHRRLDCLLHGPPKGDATLQLSRNV